MRLAPRRLRWRLSWWYASSLTLIFVLFSAGVFLFVRVSCMIPIHAQLDQQTLLVKKAIDKSLADVSKLEADGAVPNFRIMEDTRPFYTTRNWLGAQFPDKTNANPNGYWVKSASGRHYFVQPARFSRAGKTLRIDVAQDAEQAYDFERFYRIDQDRSRETGGAGLGLAIARWVIELNGGTIELESKEGSGSVFRIALQV